ncbi:RmuC family protein [Synechococcus sp. A15-44]|nr:RmuC family protein [Synechococcus sp. A15-44]
MAPTLLFITGVLAGLIAGFILSRVFGRSRSGDGSVEVRLLEERLLKADQGLAQFSQQLEAQSSELRAAQQQAQQASEQAAVSRTQLEGVSQERDALKAGHDSALAVMDQLRREKERLTATMAEVAEKLRSQESQTQFLEQARTDLLTQFRSLSGQMLDGSREALLKSTKETVSEPFAKEVLQCPTNADHRGCRPACETDLRGSAAQRHAPCSPAERENLQWRPGRRGIGPTADAQR